jgi:hypothetical protein
MRHIKNILGLTLLLGMIVTSMSGCYETHYYHRNHHHTRGWYDRHHEPPPAGVNWDVEIHN